MNLKQTILHQAKQSKENMDTPVRGMTKCMKENAETPVRGMSKCMVFQIAYLVVMSLATIYVMVYVILPALKDRMIAQHNLFLPPNHGCECVKCSHEDAVAFMNSFKELRLKGFSSITMNLEKSDVKEHDEGGCPKQFRIRRGTKEESYNPFDGDESASCRAPDGLKTVEILCKMWPQSTTCISYCAYGKTLDEGITRTHFCSHEENTWSKEFEECKPFVDCRLRLTAPGDLQCIENKLTESPTCRISCEKYEDKDVLKNETFSCKSDGSWEPELPFCVELDGTPLVRAPEVLEHAEISYPEKPGKA